MEKTKKNILITGSTGMLGSELAGYLKNKYRVIPLNSGDCDITDSKRISRIFRCYRPWLALHTAGYTDVDGCEIDKQKAYSVNAKGSAVIARAAKSADCILVYISSDYVFSGKKICPYTEKDRPGPVNEYGKSKLEGERAVRSLLKKHIIIRTSWLFGKKRRNFIDNVVNWAKSKKEMRIIQDKYASPTYTLDLAKAIGRLIYNIEQSPNAREFYGTYHLTNSGYCSWLEYARFIVKAYGGKAEITPVKLTDSEFKAKRPVFSALDNSKFTRLTGCKMRPWKEAVREYIRCRYN